MQVPSLSPIAWVVRSMDSSDQFSSRMSAQGAFWLNTPNVSRNRDCVVSDSACVLAAMQTAVMGGLLLRSHAAQG
jgi:hypothetical protein